MYELKLLPDKRFGKHQVVGFNIAYFEYYRAGWATAVRCPFLTFAFRGKKEQGEGIEGFAATEELAWDMFDETFPQFLDTYFPAGGDTLCWRMLPECIQDTENKLYYVRARVVLLNWGDIDTFLMPNWISLPKADPGTCPQCQRALA